MQDDMTDQDLIAYLRDQVEYLRQQREQCGFEHARLYGALVDIIKLDHQHDDGPRYRDNASLYKLAVACAIARDAIERLKEPPDDEDQDNA